MKHLLILSFLFVSPSVFAEGEFQGVSTDENETVIDSSYYTGLQKEEPVFASMPSARDIASFVPETSSQDLGWQGQLTVLKEIPYSYPAISHHTMQLRVLNEIEQEASKKSSH